MAQGQLQILKLTPVNVGELQRRATKEFQHEFEAR